MMELVKWNGNISYNLYNWLKIMKWLIELEIKIGNSVDVIE